MTSLVVLGFAAVAGAGPLKLAVTPLVAGEGVPAATAVALTSALASELGTRSGVQVISQRELDAVLSLESQKQLMGCASESCWAEVGQALAVDGLVVGDVAKLGASWLVHLKRIDVRAITVAAQADRRFKGGTIDDVLDALPAMVTQLVGDVPPGPVASPPPPPPPATLPRLASGTDEPLALSAADRARLKVYGDAQGRYVALVPFGDTSDPFLAGDGRRLYRQRLVSRSRMGDVSFDFTFWEPRVTRGAESQLGQRQGRVTLTCGEHELAYTELSTAAATGVLGEAKLFEQRWRRYARALARGDDGTWYFVDGGLGADGRPTRKADLRLYVGRKGNVGRVAVDEVIADTAGELLVTARGSLRLGRDKDGAAEAEWSESGRKLPLTSLDPAMNGPLIYGELGVYAGEALGTPCDPYL